nr:hypothetical protein [Providencia sp. PROV024]
MTTVSHQSCNVRSCFGTKIFRTRVSTTYTDSALGMSYLVEDLLGFRPGVFPGVFLLSRRRWSGLPVESAIGFGPGFKLMI